MGKEEVVEEGVETFSKTDSGVVLSGGDLHADVQRVVSNGYELRDEDRATVSPNTTRRAINSEDMIPYKLEDQAAVRGTNNCEGNNGTGELISANEHVILTLVGVTNSVEVDGNDIPRMMAISRQMEGAGRVAANLGAATDFAAADVESNISVEAKPVVEAGD